MAETFNHDKLFSGIVIPVKAAGITVVSGAGVLARGSVLGKITASGKYKIVNSANSDGSQAPDCVLGEAIDATSADVVTSAYYTGEFNGAALVFGGTDTTATHKAALRAKNIFIDTTVSA